VTKCLIWGTSARAEPRLGDYEHINSRRAGGEYKMPGRCGVACTSRLVLQWASTYRSFGRARTHR
jgi:hypothetical protein